MNQNTSRILVAVLWIASVGAAYFIGQTVTSVDSSAGKDQASSADSAETAAARDRKARSIVESFDGAEAAAARAGGKQNIPELIARTRAEMASGMNGMANFRGMLRAIAPLAELDAEQIQQALQEVEKTIREPQQKVMFYSLLLGQWAETDGPAALAYAEEKLKSKSPFDVGVHAAVIGAWSRKDPDAAWRWYETKRKGQDSDPNSGFVVSTLFAGMAGRDLDVALTRLNSLEDQQRAMALNGIASSAWDERSRQRLLDRAETLSPEMRTQLQHSLLRPWAMSDPDAAVKWYRSRSPEEQSGMRTVIGSTMMMMDPVRGAEVMLDGASEKEKPQVYDTIVGQWSFRDPKAAGEWLSKQPQGAELDNARRTYAVSVANRDPNAAMVWAKSIVDGEQRASSVQQVYVAWRSRDATAADAGLDSSGLDAAKIEEIRQNAPKNPAPRRAGGFAP